MFQNFTKAPNLGVVLKKNLKKIKRKKGRKKPPNWGPEKIGKKRKKKKLCPIRKKKNFSPPKNEPPIGPKYKFRESPKEKPRKSPGVMVWGGAQAGPKGGGPRGKSQFFLKIFLGAL